MIVLKVALIVRLKGQIFEVGGLTNTIAIFIPTSKTMVLLLFFSIAIFIDSGFNLCFYTFKKMVHLLFFSIAIFIVSVFNFLDS